ncbi:hypothetical protein [Azotosporobacter soli]|uniref:hypothetical protein n=1 Tax=Azotosporobacter soli TaxID=3055040 RepID=UPI0031FF222C
MNLFNKKNLTALAIGGLLLSGIAAPLAVQAAENPRPLTVEQRMGERSKMTQEFGAQFGISESEMQSYREKGVSMRDLGHAAMLAKISGKPLADVMAAKTLNTSWKDLSQSLGVTPQQMKAARQDMIASRMESKLNINKQTSLDLMNQGYRTKDIAVAGLLAADTNKSITDVLSQKKINNSWHDVANTLGVSDETFQQNMQTLRHAVPPMGGHKGPRMTPNF